MALTDNNGTQYYAKPIGVTSTNPNLSSNNGTSYYWLSANDYVLYGQSTKYVHPSSNNVLQYYFYQCGVASDAGINLQSNNGTKYFYREQFNCVVFDTDNPSGFTSLRQPDNAFVYTPEGTIIYTIL